MRTILLLTSLLVLRSFRCARRPAALPTQARQRLAAIRESFKRYFVNDTYHTDEIKQFLVMTVGDTGFTPDNPLPLCVTEGKNDFNFLSRACTDDPHSGFLNDIKQAIRGIVQRYGDSHNGAGNVNIFIYNMPSSSYWLFTNTIVRLAARYPSLTFHLGYEVASMTNTIPTRYQLSQLSRLTNIFASNVRGSVNYKVLNSTSGSTCWLNVTGDKQPMLLAANKQLHRGPLSQNPGDAWLSQATTIGSVDSNWNSSQHLLLSPSGKLYRILNGVFYTGDLPIIDTMNWQSTARTLYNDSEIGQRAKHVLFHPKGDLYWVQSGREDQLFNLGDPEQNNAVPVETQVGATGWADFKFLNFDPVTGDLYGVANDQLFAAPPPESPNLWTRHAAWLGTRSWGLFTHLFFDPYGVLYAVTQNDQLLAAPPPEYPTDCWNCRAKIVSDAGWQEFKFLFFEPTDGSA